jgi:hypothetical protein
MNRRLTTLIILVPAALLSGCASMTPTERGVAGGGLIGAGTGALVGKAVGNTGAGAVIGAAAGAVSGGLIGNEIERSERRTEAKLAAQAQPPAGPLGLTDVVQLSQSQVSDSVIVSQIRASGSVYQLSSNDTIWLKQQGVSDVVVQEMLATAHRPPRRVYSPTPVIARPVYVVEPPPPVIGIGIGYRPRRHCW